ncbi:MAG: hypothetical protein J3K34DRAFT_399799 [Monoraphidium minutum]|nr:MAG: hypothetical protein J3K34DRAFT_399799 [Monoraphidium minutum]
MLDASLPTPYLARPPPCWNPVGTFEPRRLPKALCCSGRAPAAGSRASTGRLPGAMRCSTRLRRTAPPHPHCPALPTQLSTQHHHSCKSRVCRARPSSGLRARPPCSLRAAPAGSALCCSPTIGEADDNTTLHPRWNARSSPHLFKWPRYCPRRPPRRPPAAVPPPLAPRACSSPAQQSVPGAARASATQAACVCRTVKPPADTAHAACGYYARSTRARATPRRAAPRPGAYYQHCLLVQVTPRQTNLTVTSV